MKFPVFWQSFQISSVFPDRDFFEGHFPFFPSVGTLTCVYGHSGVTAAGIELVSQPATTHFWFLCVLPQTLLVPGLLILAAI